MTTKDNQIAVLMDRVAELEELLGIDAAHCDPFMAKLKLPPNAARMLGYLMKRAIAHKQALYDAAYSHLPEADQPDDIKGALGVNIWKLRNALDPHGIKIKTVWHVGWSISQDDKAKVIALIEADEQPEALHLKKTSEGERRL